MAEDAFYRGGFVNQADDLHLMAARRITKWVQYPDLANMENQAGSGSITHMLGQVSYLGFPGS